ncbi:uncharacterized protein PHALS_04140 [Plasmopara halstedii]|uniref:PH domain-containing protein n=1 Tax=Plasmopara halstedii TaxID=4781 RepID=A0A0P1A9D6_PLAHL|nr:uncharacterized protein PHALS_04140 [Plasmopara halstedii]CEG36887.1 hypothetical protein PHALS_04140 [Plasmopara halstedii]|eukprot:XP_024573256.1 hypothetical protein PHALS_04140 [Plasmopara halstedii]
MTCAGYLVVNNTHLAYVEIFTGLLVCFLDLESFMDPDDVSNQAPVPLETRRMMKVEAHTSSCKIDDQLQQPESEIEPQDSCKRQRLLQLSGYRIEVVDQDVELDVPSLPCSFQVNTYKVHLRPDGSFISTLSDSLILTATNHETKQTWVKNIKFWNRFGWRETTQVAATHRDLVQLQEKLETYNNVTFAGAYLNYSNDATPSCERNIAVMTYGGCSSITTQSAYATKRQTRRRFYRAPAPGAFVHCCENPIKGS